MAASFILKASEFPMPAKGATYGFALSYPDSDPGYVGPRAWIKSYNPTDTMINGITYLYDGRDLFRNESGKVYLYYAKEHKEYLLYDFNLKEGDTLYFIPPYMKDSVVFVIKSNSTVTMSNGETRREQIAKLLNYGCDNASHEYICLKHWIEGIGDTKDGLFYDYSQPTSKHDWDRLVCYNDSTGIKYPNNKQVSCVDYILELKKVNTGEIEDESIYAYIDGVGVLHISSELELISFIISDLGGKQILFSNSKSASIAGIATGIYALTATFENGSTYSGMVTIP
jgi:hypothetical protein